MPYDTYFGGDNSLPNLILPNFGQFRLFWAVFGHFWAPRVPECFPQSYLTLMYIKRYQYIPILGVTILSRISSYSIMVNLAYFGLFLAIF